MDLRGYLAGIVGVLVVASSCGSDEGEQAVSSATELRFRSVWDFAYVFPEPETDEAVRALISVADLGIDEETFTAMLGHAMGDFRLPDAAADDTVLRPGTTELTIFHEECLRDVERWRVSQVRFAPYEMGVPGTVSAYSAHAAAHDGDFRQVMHVRLTLHNFCFANDFILREDQAFHLIYALHPDDPALAERIFGSADEFVAHQLAAAANRPASYAALAEHLQALGSPEYATFRRGVLADWAQLAALNPEGTKFTASDGEAQSFRDGLVSYFDDKFRVPEPDFNKPSPHHPGLEQAGAVRDGLTALVKRYATRKNWARVAAMFTEGGQDAEDFRWFFSQMTPGAYDALPTLGEGAEAIYGHVTPRTLDTFVAVRSSAGVDVTRVTSAGYYSESRGVISGPVRLSASSAIRKETNKVDYIDFPKPASPENGGDDGMAEIPTGKPLRDAMLRFTDVEVANASTTPCDRCHNLENVERHDSAFGYRQSEQTVDAYQFHAIAPGKLNLRTVREIDEELRRANEELARGDGGGGSCTPRVVINEVMTEGSSASDEFVELYNASDCDADIGGFVLEYSSKNNSKPVAAWKAASGTTLGKRTFLVIAALTTGLSRQGGGLGLRAPDGALIDAIAWDSVISSHRFIEGKPSPNIPARSSAARVPDGADSGDNRVDVRVVASPTPGASNGT